MTREEFLAWFNGRTEEDREAERARWAEIDRQIAEGSHRRKGEIVAAIQAGENVPNDVLAWLVGRLEDPLPHQVRRLVAERLTNGPPPTRPPTRLRKAGGFYVGMEGYRESLADQRRVAEARRLLREYESLRRGWKQRRVFNPATRATEELARAQFVQPSTMDAKLKQARQLVRKTPP